MQLFNHCPECGVKLRDEKRQRCACGWHKEKLQAERCTDYRCHYQSAGRRCPLPGTICPYPYGSTPWYCSGHLSSIGDSRLSEAVLLDAEKNYQTILEKRGDWRDRLLNTSRDPQEKSLRE